MYTLTQKIEFIESVFGSGRLGGGGKNFDVRCPICAPSDASKKKLSIRTDDDRLHCWVCGYKARSLAPLIRKYGTVSQLATYREVFSRLDDSLTERLDVAQRVSLPEDFKLLVDCSTKEPDVRAAWRYLTERGLDERIAWRYRIGLSSDFRWRRRLIVPSHDARGDLNFFVARAIDPSRRPKYDSPDVDKNPIVFNEIDVSWTEPVMIVEGVFDAMKCPDNTLPILGSDLDERHEVFNKIILNQTKVFLALDSDMFFTKTRKILRKLVEYDVDVKLVDLRPHADPGSMDPEEVVSAMSNAKTPTWEDDFQAKLLNSMSRRSTFVLRHIYTS